MDQPGLKKLLTIQSDKLNDMVLDYVGIDYLKKLDENLDLVKTELLSEVSKPTKSKDDIIMALTDSKLFIEKSENIIDSLKTDENNASNDLHKLGTDISQLNDQLLNLGNVPEEISNNEKELGVVSEFIANFKKQDKKPEIDFVEIKPELDKIALEEISNQITINLKSIDTSNFRLKEIQENRKLFLESIKSHKTDILDCITQKIKICEDDCYYWQESMSLQFKEIAKYFETTLNKLQIKLVEKQKISTETNYLQNEILKSIEVNLKTIKSGYCDKCGKAFGDNPEEMEKHKQNLTNANIQLKIDGDNLKLELNEINILIGKINNLITTYTRYHISAIKQEVSILENDLVIKDCNPIIIEIKELLYKIEKFQNKIVELKNDRNNWTNLDIYDIQLVEKIQDNYLNSIISNIKMCDVDLQKETNLKNKIVDAIINYDNDIRKINETHINLLESYQILFDTNIKENKEIKIFNENVDIHNNSLIISESEYSKLLVVEQNLKNDKLSRYTSLKEWWDSKITQETELTLEYRKITKSIHEEELKLQQFKNQLELVKKQYDSYLKYQKNNLMWKIYSKLIKNNFKEVIFEYYRTFLNNSLNILLEDVPFKLFWNDDSDLYHISFENGICTYQPVQQSSGMETTYLALALVYTIHLLNIKNSISHIFIDEISGTLNAGTELTYQAQNYKELLVLVLNKFHDKSIFIIDHSIENLFETVTYEVQPGKNGSKYVQLD
jgi:hypothetical protein